MEYYLLIPFLPLAAFILNILLGKEVFREKAHWVSILAVVGSFIIAVATLFDVISGKTLNEDLYTWIVSGTFKASVGFLIDPLTAVMLIVVTTCSSLIQIYSIGYMHGDKGYYRFFAYMSLFTFCMLMLAMSNNFLQLYFGWEGVGLCSYFLIGYYFHKKSASDAGKKAFIVNRFGDFGFGLGVIIVFLTFGTLHYLPVFNNMTGIVGKTVHLLGFDVSLVTLIALLLFCGAVGKSAQIPLHVWLPDAMEGPTPVSALIHAATMVTAGVFLVARCSPIFNLSEVALIVVALTGAITALFAATIALVQKDIKRIIAYSTISQLGYMFLGCGVGAYAAGIFHLYTHAFFKALLFLCAGSVMHAMGGELNIQKMGGLKKYMPVTYLTFVLGSLSISGIPGFAGFFSKDEILWLAYSSPNPVGKFVWLLGTIAAFLTAFYSFRLIFLTFHGKFRGTHEQEHHLHESPKVMTIPLILLSIGAIAAGWVGIPHLLGGGAHFAEFLKSVLGHPEAHGTHNEEWMVMGISVIVGLSGIGLAAYMYLARTDIPVRLAKNFSSIYRTLFNKYYVDELYSFTIVRPTLWTAKNILIGFTDAKIIEGIVNGVPRLIGKFSGMLRKVQTGLVHHYATIIAAGAFFIIALAILLR
ncbi:MAG: NADH-quinone oxidoreductase subunit L [Nitrospirae bacterium CG_4_10_14_0_8_um_filter_41_23]|nr:MAG: NADH-quinone oxidoreductase subunit L [Nitrospirae bacterium CG02_land_8_20_14_3_00_41_53]PIY85900.1 MAG: NADH-quinone oxidoreductase subunit L [Nitrospirae bacterium CG_4_10_14_0_8_um_filter_41_23]PJA80218.1 MAG: NADH-quinone oxidoreductase subunit L [Nitrospirae bacterium CG_4_9_14_3_um_filter_41_27]